MTDDEEKRGPGAPPGSQNARKHGMYAVATRGPEALPEILRGRELEFIGNVATHDGVLRELEASARRQWAICETGYAYLAALLRDGTNIWSDGPKGEPVAILKRLGSYENGLVRTLGRLAELRNDRDTLEIDYEAQLAKAKERMEQADDTDS